MCKSVNLYCQKCQSRGWPESVFATVIEENGKLLLMVPGYPAKIESGFVYCQKCMSRISWSNKRYTLKQSADNFPPLDMSQAA